MYHQSVNRDYDSLGSLKNRIVEKSLTSNK